MITTQTVPPPTSTIINNTNSKKVSEVAAAAVKNTARAASSCSPIASDLQILSNTCNTEKLNSLVDELSQDMARRLADSNNHAMLPTAVSALPTGYEKGSCLSVDLGGSTCRVAFIQLDGAKHTVKNVDDSHVPYRVLYKVAHPVGKDTKNLSGKGFFLWIGQKIKDAIDYAIEEGWLKSDYEELVMGLSWSFPFKQDTVERGLIEPMGKGYEVSDEIVGWDLKDSFENVAKELGMRFKVTAVVNDTLASLISHAYDSYTTKMSLILGTGLNACAMLPLSEMNGKIKGLKLGPDATGCLVNTELSLLSGGIIPDTKWDREIDINNEKPGFQPFEEKTSGRYIGEMCRLTLRDLINNKELLGGVMPTGINEPFALESKTVSDVEEFYYQGRLDLAKEKLFSLHPYNNGAEVSDEEMNKICSIFIAISTRAAALTAAALVAVSQLCPKEMTECTIAYDGTVIERYPKFRTRTQDYLNLLGQPRNRFLKLEPTGDGSLLGPAIASAMFRQRA